MKILVLSDSHGSTAVMRTVIQKFEKDAGAVIHLGDFFIDAIRNKPECSLHFVRGNCDGSSYDGAEVPTEKVVDIGGIKIFMTHGHRYGVKYGMDRLVYAALEREADVCLYGHTHAPAVFREEGIIYMNPGSISRPRDARAPSYGVLDIENSAVTASVVGMVKGSYMLLLSM